jgi:glycosyltransferase involved in cell wall biosynthesis
VERRIRLQKMKRLLLFIDSEPFVGGAFQYNQAILEAALSLPAAEYDLRVVYTHALWRKVLPPSVKSQHIPISERAHRALQVMLSTLPTRFLTTLLRGRHPVARALTDAHADLCVFPSQETYWGYLANVPSLVAIHDLMHRYERRFAEAGGPLRYFHRERHFKKMRGSVRGVLVDSSLGKKHVCESYAFDPSRVYELPYTAPKYMFAAVDEIGDRYKLPQKFVFYPAQFWPHKNHLRLVEAIAALRDDTPDIQLVLVGGKKRGYQDIANAVDRLGLRKNVHFVGFVPDQDLAAIYRRATAMIMPTFFGPTNIPPLEAFATGCPAAVSNIYGMPEQLGDAALFFDPSSVSEIANVIKRLWTDDALRLQLAAKGKARIESWGPQQFNARFRSIIEAIIFESRL